MIRATNKAWAQVLRLIGTLGLLFASLYALNLAVFHSWAAGFPSSSHPEWHGHWADIFLALTALLFVSALAFCYCLRRKKAKLPHAPDPI